MIDIHSHLLPGVDDGSRSIEESVAVLERFRDDGVTRIVLTPHLQASDVARAPHEKHAAILAELRKAAPEGLELSHGWEIMLDVPRADFTSSGLSLAGSSAVLVEFPRRGVPVQATEELYRIRCSGVVPVLAHPERYPGCTLPMIAEWRSVGTVMQVDTAALAGSGAMSRLAHAMLEEGLVDIFSSDNHGDMRSLRSARDWLLEMGADDHAMLLTSTNARRLLDDQPLTPVPPLPRRSGMFERLKALFLRS